MNDDTKTREAIEAIYRNESRRVLATLIRLLGDFDIAEEALHEAFRAALEHWPGLRVEEAATPPMGLVFRKPRTLPVAWDA